MDSNAVWTISAVITLTAFIVSQIKIWLGNTKYLRTIPLIVVAVGVAMGVTVLAQAAGYLQGSLGQLLAQAVLAALGSGGLYNVITGSALQRLDETAIHPTTKGTNSLLVGEVVLADDEGHGHTPQWPAALLFVLFSTTFVISGCNLMQTKPIDPLSPQGRYYQAKEDYLSVLEFFTFLRDQHVVTQRWMNEQQPAFDAAQGALKIWGLSLQSGTADDQRTAEQRFRDAADVLRQLREQYEKGSTTRPATKVSEYDDRGNPRAGGAGPDDRGSAGARESRADSGGAGSAGLGDREDQAELVPA